MELSFKERFSRFVLVVGVVGVVLALALIYNRLSDETFTLVLGIGIALVVLAVLLAIIGGILYLLIRGMEARAALKRSSRAPSNQPPVFVLNGQPQALPQMEQPAYDYPHRTRSRQFTVIGED